MCECTNGVGSVTRRSMTRVWGTVALLAISVGCSASRPTNATTVTATTSALARHPTAAIATNRAVRQPHAVRLPAPPAEGISVGSRGPIVLEYQRRLRELHFDPGPVDGVYTQDTADAVVAVEKLLGLARDGTIGPHVQRGLEHFTYQAARPDAEGERIEIDLDTQVLTVYQHSQPILLTTTSTGSGEYFCGGTDGCQYAITPTGRFHLQYLHQGWDSGKLGKMWNPYYFDGGIAIHGLPSVPSYPASHGCARIPMHIANYFQTLVTAGESVYVVGTAKKAGNRYVGPVPTTTTVTSTTTTTTTSYPSSSTTLPRPTTTTNHPTTTATTKPT